MPLHNDFHSANDFLSAVIISARKISLLPFTHHKIWLKLCQLLMRPMKPAFMRQHQRKKINIFVFAIAQPSTKKWLYLLDHLSHDNFLTILMVTWFWFEWYRNYHVIHNLCRENVSLKWQKKLLLKSIYLIWWLVLDLFYNTHSSTLKIICWWRCSQVLYKFLVTLYIM